jgi:ATP-dependent helicase/DNAse subunit B
MRLIRGGPGTGKTALVFHELKQALGEGAPARLVVPTATLVRHFRHELARDGLVFAPGTVVSLAGLVQNAAEPLKPAPEGLLRAFVREALRRDRPAEFAAVADTEGMASTILETIALFENAGAAPDRLLANRKLKSHGKAFARIWAAVAARVRDRGFANRTQIVREAAARISGQRLWFDGFATFSPLEAELLQALDKTCGVTITLTDSSATAEFRRLALQWGAEDKLLSAAPRRPEIGAVNAVSMEREADEIARRIMELRARGTAYREIGVGLRDTESYLPLLRATFERFGIPARYYFASPLRHHPAALFLGGLMRNVLEGWEFGAALDTLRAHPQWGAGAAFDRFDFAIREAMPGRGVEALLALCEEDRLKPQLAECFAVAGWAQEKLRPEQWGARLSHLAETLYRPGRIDPPRAFADVETLRSQAAGLRAWLDAVALAPHFWPNPAAAIGLEEFWRVASESIDAASVQTRDDRRDVVHVMHVYEVRQWDIAALFVCGLTDRDFPRRAARNLLFPDSDIEALRKSGIPLRRTADLDRDEEALFDSLRGRARSSLVLTWPEHDGGGRRIPSSRYIGRLVEEGRAFTRPARLCRPEPALKIAPPGPQGRIGSPDLLRVLAERHQSISLTTLEDLAQCRFKFFAGKTLGLKARPERPQERLQARVTGLILHYALEEWLKQGRQGEFVPFFEAAFDNACREMHLPEGYKLEVERIESRRIAEQVSTTEKWTSPYPPEVEVPVSLSFPGGVTVNGRIDRIDRLSERQCIIVDYKSGKTKNVERFVESSVKLQGPLYALGVREGRGLETVAMMFHAVRDDRRYGWGEVPGADLNLKPIPERWIEDAKERTVERLAGFLAGEIHAAPTEREHCRWCDYAAACRIEEREALVMIEGTGA